MISFLFQPKQPLHPAPALCPFPAPAPAIHQNRSCWTVHPHLCLARNRLNRVGTKKDYALMYEELVGR